MKVPIVIPEGGHVFGYTYRNGGVETHRVTRYGVLDGCTLPTITAVGPDLRVYQSSPTMLHDTKLEAIREEEQSLSQEIEGLNERMAELVRTMSNTMVLHARVVEQLVKEAANGLQLEQPRR